MILSQEANAQNEDRLEITSRLRCADRNLQVAPWRLIMKEF